MRMARLAVAAVLVAAGLGGCAAEQARMAKRQDRIEAAQLGIPSQSLLQNLTPAERDALDRVGMSGPDRGDDVVDGDDPADPAADGQESTADAAGRVGVSLLQIGLTLGAIAAPFFLF